jgi:hypothetical protein
MHPWIGFQNLKATILALDDEADFALSQPVLELILSR